MLAHVAPCGSVPVGHTLPEPAEGHDHTNPRSSLNWRPNPQLQSTVPVPQLSFLALIHGWSLPCDPRDISSTSVFFTPSASTWSRTC